MQRGRGIPDSWGNNKAPNNLSPPRVSLYQCIWFVWYDQSLFHTSGSGGILVLEKEREKEIPSLLFVDFVALFWSMTFLPALSLSPTCEYLAYIFHMQPVDGSCPEQEHADKFPSVSSHSKAIRLSRHDLWSQFYAVQFDFGSHIQMFVSHLAVQQGSLRCGKSTFAPQECPPQQAL